MKRGRPPATALFSDRASGGKMQLGRDERGLIGILGLGLVGILALFGFTAMGGINLMYLIGLFAMGIIAMAVVGVVFFKAKSKLIMVAVLASMSIILLIQVNFIIIVGGFVAIFALWNWKVFKKNPLVLTSLIMTGLIVMVWGKYAVLLPMGILP